jgi:hypothetical protein
VGALIHGSTVGHDRTGQPEGGLSSSASIRGPSMVPRGTDRLQDLVRAGAVGKIRRPGRDLNLCRVWAPRWPYHPMWVPFSKTTEEKDV